MTKKIIQRYTRILRDTRDKYIGKVNNSIQQKINNIVDLYEDRKITQYGPAVNLINGIVAKDNKKGLKAYDKAVEKYEGKENNVSDKQVKALKKARDTKVRNRVDKK